MTLDPTAFAATIVASLVTGVFLNWFANYSRLHQSNAKFKHENTDLKNRLFESQDIVVQLQKRETERQEDDARRKDHGRCEQQVAILTILHPNTKTTLQNIIHASTLPEKQVIHHLICLHGDDCISSDNYEYGGKHFSQQTHLQSTWTIRPEGLRYLHINGLLEST